MRREAVRGQWTIALSVVNLHHPPLLPTLDRHVATRPCVTAFVEHHQTPSRLLLSIIMYASSACKACMVKVEIELDFPLVFAFITSVQLVFTVLAHLPYE